VESALGDANTRIYEMAEALQRLLDGMEQEEDDSMMPPLEVGVGF
jgi:hypothetical protein